MVVAEIAQIFQEIPHEKPSHTNICFLFPSVRV